MSVVTDDEDAALDQFVIQGVQLAGAPLCLHGPLPLGASRLDPERGADDPVSGGASGECGSCSSGSASPRRSCPSPAATGQPSVTHCEDWVLFTAGALAVIRCAKLHGTQPRPWLTALLRVALTKVAAIAFAKQDRPYGLGDHDERGALQGTRSTGGVKRSRRASSVM
jgi:hypothetical protein